MSYQEKKAEGGQAMVFGMSFLFVFLILAAMYEKLVAAVPIVTSVGPRCSSRCLWRIAITQIRQQRVCANWTGHADWAHGQECHPDR